MKDRVFSRKEWAFLITISLSLGIRQMAMTMVMPFISTYSKTLMYNSATLAGVALGIFGLMQAIFQIPFGILSDKIGNKRVMLIGLMQVIIGLIIAFRAKSIYMLIVARALQGSGAIIATGYSWVTSSVSDEKRPKALSLLGMIIGFAASASFALGPLTRKFLSVRQMFLISAILIFLVWSVILIFLKNPPAIKNEETLEEKIDTRHVIKELLSNRVFVTLNIAGFFNNYILVSVFYIVPIYLEKITGINGMWKVFMPAVIIAIICMRRSIKFVERGHGLKLILIAFIISAIGLVFYFNNKSFYFILIGTIFFMIAYISLCTLIPSVANEIAKDGSRGTANGIINSFQFIGSFVGSVITGALWENHESMVLVVVITISIVGLLLVRASEK